MIRNPSGAPSYLVPSPKIHVLVLVWVPGILIHGSARPSIIGCEVLVCCGDGLKISENANPTIEQVIAHDSCSWDSAP